MTQRATTHIRLALALLTAAILLTALHEQFNASSHAQDAAPFRGPDGDGRADRSNLLSEIRDRLESDDKKKPRDQKKPRSVRADSLAPFSQSDISGPVGSGAFGTTVTVLPNGNFVVTDPLYDEGGAFNIGAVYLYDGATLAVISTLKGSTQNDQVGGGGGQSPNITVLTNGNFVVRSPNWNNAALQFAGAVTWCSATTGCNGIVSASNSLVGGRPADFVGSGASDSGGVVALTNGNYIVRSPNWDNPSPLISNVGAVTWGNGTTGITGLVTASNSLIGGRTDDLVGGSFANLGGVVALTNGNYVVSTPNWDNPSPVTSNVGAVTWCNGNGGTVGLVSSGNSLIGGTADDQFGNMTSDIGPDVLALTNGNYVTGGPGWNNPAGSIADVGAVAWGNGATGTVGVVSPANSLVGGTFNDQVGNGGVVALTNGNYVVSSFTWNDPAGPITQVGAVTWGNGTGGTVGPVTGTNSLTGGRTNDFVGRGPSGAGGVVALTNGNYVVNSPFWANPAGPINLVGAVTLGNGMTGTVGLVTPVNSLVGGTFGDQVGFAGVTALANGNYVVNSAFWNNPSPVITDVGAVTWGNGTTGISGLVTASNSLTGGRTTDVVGVSGVTALSNGNYVVNSSSWTNPAGPITQVGAATWGNGTTGISGLVTASNSLIGGSSFDRVGFQVTALTNGNYVATSSSWSNPSPAIQNVGAVTWGDGTTGAVGLVSASNSLIGGRAFDFVGSPNTGQTGALALANGNYVVQSDEWDNPSGPISNARAVTYGNGATGTIGLITSANSVLGTVENGISENPGFSFDATRNRLFVGRSASNTVSILFFNTTAVADGNLDNPATWDNGVPTALVTAVIPTGRTVTINTATTIGSLEVQAGATLTMNANLNLAGNLALGTQINTGANTLGLSCSSIVSGVSSSNYVIGNLRKEFCATGSFSFPTGTMNGFSPVTVNITAGTFPAGFTVKAVQGAHPDIDNFGEALQRYWTLTATGVTASLTFNYLDPIDIPASASESNFHLFKFNGSFIDLGGSGLDAAANTYTFDGADSFSDWTLAEPGAPTAIALASFTASAYDNGALLEWQTGFEADNLGFNIHRDEGGKRTLINDHLIAGTALVAGSRSLLAGRSYAWWDNGISDCGSGMADCRNAAYWLEDIDLHGQATWHGPFHIKQVGGNPPPRSNAAFLAEIVRNRPQEGASRVVERTTAATRVSQQQEATQRGLASRSGVKIRIKSEGWYRVTQPELASIGFDTRVDPRLLQLFVDGRELPMLVRGDEDARLDPSDAIEFYGLGLDSPFTDSRVYWLVAGSTPGLRIAREKSEGAPTLHHSFTETVERRDRTIYFSALRNGEQENFFGSVIAQNPVDQTLTLSHVAPDASRGFLLELAVQGVTLVRHSVNVELNGAHAGVLFLDGQSKGLASFDLPHSLLREGQNVVRLTSLGGQSDVCLVDFIRISYQRGYTADNNYLKLTAPGFEQITIGGFTSDSVRVFDVTDPNSPQEILGAIEKQKYGYAISFTTPQAGERSLLALAAEQRPAGLSLNLPSNLRAGSADFVIITRHDIAESIQPLVALRRLHGLFVALVEVEDIYDEFSFGQKTPFAIRDFLAFANSKWKKKPRFVLLAGDSTFDPRNYLGFGDADRVPTKLIDTDFMETSSDDWFSDFDGNGIANIATGRLPARTAEELSRMVSKIISYEQSGPAEEVLLVADANDGFDFELASTKLRSLTPPTLRIVQVNRGRLDAESARSSLFEALYRKQLLVNYAGHGSVNTWRANLLTNEDAEALRNDHLPMFVMMTCLNGYFHDAGLDSLGERLLKAERGGAVAVWASSGLTFPADQSLLNQELYRLLFNPGRRLTIGEAVMRAKSSTSDSDIRRTWILLGDPATILK